MSLVICKGFVNAESLSPFLIAQIWPFVTHFYEIITGIVLGVRAVWLSHGSLQGKNDFGKIGYGGPCPLPGRPHRYQFTLYALDKLLNLKGAASKKQIMDAMQGHILAQGHLTGTYEC
ncbi:YbhB/YbcL family Raf kinase inhibitor-like protein [Chloroflexota bacterium]